jgi:hypothetical protein
LTAHGLLSESRTSQTDSEHEKPEILSQISELEGTHAEIGSRVHAAVKASIPGFEQT